MDDCDVDEDVMTEEILKLSKSLGSVIAKYTKENEVGSLLIIPITAIALADCITRLADAADKAMGTNDQRDHLMKLITKFVKERPNCVENVRKGH